MRHRVTRFDLPERSVVARYSLALGIHDFDTARRFGGRRCLKCLSFSTERYASFICTMDDYAGRAIFTGRGIVTLLILAPELSARLPSRRRAVAP